MLLFFANNGPATWPIGLNWLLRAPRRTLLIAALRRSYLLKALQMPYVGDWSPVDGAERVPLSIDLTAFLPAGDAFASVTSANCAAYYGTDGNASALLYGSPVLSGNIVTQWLDQGGVANVVYRIGFVVQTSAGAILTPYGHIACNPIN